MTDRDVIDKIYSQLIGIVSGDEYEFHSLSGSWGYKSSDVYQRKVVMMNKNSRRLGKDCPVLFNDGDFWLFDGKIYVPIREELIVAAYFLLIEHLEILPAINNKLYAKTFTDAIRYYNPMVQSRNLIAFTNGVLDIGPILKGNKPIFYEHFDQRFHVTYYHPYKYDEKAKCIRWMNFLHEVLPDKNSRVILQMFLGLGLIDQSEVYLPYEGKDAARVELCLLLIGTGGNGKSVIYRTARGVYGSERISEVPYVELTMTGDEGMRARLALRNRVFNWSTEENSRDFCRKHTATFKKIVSGEPVMDRKLGGNVTKNDNLPYLVFHLNELPYPDDQSLGFLRRLQFISFDVTVPRERRNPRLAQELITNYPGIFNWIVRGAREVVRRRFIFPSCEGHRRQMLLAQLRTNPAVAWLNAYQLRPEPNAQNEIGEYISSTSINESIAQFCIDNDVECPSQQKVGATMTRFGCGFHKRRDADGVKYLVFGCTTERIMHPYVIRDEDLSVEYDTQKGTYIDEND